MSEETGFKMPRIKSATQNNAAKRKNSSSQVLKEGTFFRDTRTSRPASLENKKQKQCFFMRRKEKQRPKIGEQLGDAINNNSRFGGMISNRIPAPGGPCPWIGPGNSIKPNFCTMEFTNDNCIPLFSRCPDWIKPLLYAEFQVPSPRNQAT